MSDPKPLVINLFELNTPGHITHGLWRQEGNRREHYKDIGFWLEEARIAEAGGFDAIFFADVVGAYDVYDNSIRPALREGLQIPNNDPLLVVAAMAAVTEHLGFGVTASTSYEAPFAFARRISTLDHLTHGRIGWNVVTSYLPNAARNFGLDQEIPHGERFRIADEFLQVVYKLWEGSWDDDAVLVDREHGVYTDPDKVRAINHRGEHFSVAGPHLSEPSPQRTPVLFQATSSELGIAFAAKHAEVVFTTDRPPGTLKRNAAALRDGAEANGRARSDVRHLVMGTIITGRTEAQVDEKLARYRSFASAEGKFIHMSVPFHPLAHPQRLTVREALELEGREDVIDAGSLPLELTIEEFSRSIDEAWDPEFFVAGTPDLVADEIERWLDEEHIDGINLRQYHSFETAQDFAELIAPVLRKRGRLRDYEPGQTLRERIFGDNARLPERHPAAQYRGGRYLD